MSADLPSIRFPLPILAIPPLPGSTVEPVPPDDDPRLHRAFTRFFPGHWYMYSALQNSDNYPNGLFSWESSDVHMGDVVVPSFASAENHPEAKEEEQASSWRMVCYTCPHTAYHEEPDRNTTTGYPFCDERMLTVPPLISHSNFEDPGLEVPIPPAHSDIESMMACAVQLFLKSSWTTTHTSLTDLDMVTSQFFMANRSIRGSESQYPGRRYLYNETFPQGVPDEPIEEPVEEPFDASGPFATPTPTTTTRGLYWWETTSLPGYGYTSTSRPSWDEDNDSTESGSKTGILIGTMVPLFILVVVITFFFNLKKRRESSAKTSTSTSAPTPRNFDPAADARRQAGLPERRYIARRNQAAAQAAAASISNGTVIARPDDPEELPPAYHKVVTNLERIEIEQQMHAERNATEALPPAYPDARNADSTLVSRPEPIASISGQSSDLYPTLPPSPQR